MKKIGIFCSASEEIAPIYFEKARELGIWLGQNQKTLVYGGANLGLMECVAKAARESGAFIMGVVPTKLEERGAVSEAVVRSMALGACRVTGADRACAVSGVAGPGGGTPEKPVGTVWIGWSLHGETRSRKFHFSGDRDSVRAQTVCEAVRGMWEWIREE